MIKPLWTPRATLADPRRFEGKAELVNGRIVPLLPTGDLPGVVAGEIFVSRRNHARATGQGIAYPDGIGYPVLELPSAPESFSPDASYYGGPRPANRMRFIEGPPTLAVEVRSENDYGDTAQAEMAAKRADYFAAGTLAVWDVDPLAQTVAVYRATPPRSRWSTGAATRPSRGPLSWAGKCLWMRFSRNDQKRRVGILCRTASQWF
jgi:Uma2 family endonuclease